jgi:organic radical activating enzyme
MNPEILDQYTRLEHSNPEHASIVNVNWCMGNTCNFACSYCPDSLHNGSTGWYDYEKVVAFCDKVINHYDGRLVYFEFTGGEVTLWKHFPELCKYLKSRGADVGFISNSSRTIRWWNDIADHVDHVCLSFHPEFGDKDHFLEVVKLTSQKFRTHVNIMMKPDMFLELFEFATKVNKVKNISIALQPLLKDFSEEIYPYSTQQKHILDNQHELVGKHIVYDRDFKSYRGAMAMVTPEGKRVTMAPQKFIGMQRNNWQGWNCWAGLEQIVIDMDGSIYRGWCRVGGRIGHILKEDLQLPSNPVLCNKTNCHCNFDIMSTKEKVNG